MKNLLSYLIVVGLLFSTTALAQSSEFQTSFFSKALVKTVLSQQDCSGLRMYPAIDKSNEMKTVMIVAIDASGNELSSKYQMFTGVVGNNPNYSSLSKANARSACEAYFSENKQFVSQINKATAESFISGTSLGIAIQLDASQKGNFMVSGYVNTGGLKSTGNSKPGDPCPSACGDPRQYLAFPKSTR